MSRKIHIFTFIGITSLILQMLLAMAASLGCIVGIANTVTGNNEMALMWYAATIMVCAIGFALGPVARLCAKKVAQLSQNLQIGGAS